MCKYTNCEWSVGTLQDEQRVVTGHIARHERKETLTSTAVLEDRLCFFDIRLVALLLLRLPSASASAFFLQQVQHLPPLLLQQRNFLSQPHFPAAEGCSPDIDPSSTEILDPPIIPALEPARIPTLEPAIDLPATHLQQLSFLKQTENLL